MELFRELTGHLPPHMDGHQHVHVLPGKEEIFSCTKQVRGSAQRGLALAQLPYGQQSPPRDTCWLLQCECSHLSPRSCPEPNSAWSPGPSHSSTRALMTQMAKVTPLPPGTSNSQHPNSVFSPTLKEADQSQQQTGQFKLQC